jgi:hypothetical protein
MSTYYDQVYALTSPHLLHFRNDLETLDREMLTPNVGEFIHSSRDSGTDVMIFDTITNAIGWDWAATFTLRPTNTLFLHGKDGQVREITRETAIRIAGNHVGNIAQRAAKIELGEGDASEQWDAKVHKRAHEIAKELLQILASIKPAYVPKGAKRA